MIDLPLTPQIRKWLDSDDRSDQALRQGAELILRVTRNRILYTNLTVNIRAKAKAIEYQLTKILKQRMIDTTRKEVAHMMRSVDRISSIRGLDKPENTTARSPEQLGRRADHHLLPPEVQKLYTDNADIRRRMRDCHTHLRLISSETSTCPDNDRYPWAKQIIELDKQYRRNWELYDLYVRGTALADTRPYEDARRDMANASRYCSMLLGQYAKNPTAALANRIRAAFAKINSPSEALANKIKAAGLDK